MAIFSNMISVFFLVFFVTFASSDQYDDLTKSINTFSTYFFKELSGEKDYDGKNIFTSPMTVHIALSLLSCGAQGDTLKDMDNGLNYTNDKTKDSYKKAIQDMKNELELTDKVYVQDGQKLNDDFKQKASDIFQSTIESIDFSKSGDAANKMSTWVEDNTGNNVKNFTNSSDVNSQTTVAIVNTLYAKADWQNQFDPSNTKDEEFYIDNTHQVPVNTMKQQMNTNYGEDKNLDAKIVQLALKNNNASMVFILPNTKTGLNDTEKKLKKTDMKKLVQSLKSEDVLVSLPKFKLNTTANLNEALSNLGMSIMFNDKADFSGVMENSNTQLKVKNVIQKTFIDFNEKGVSESGASAPYVVKKFNQKRFAGKEFKANHPYFFALYNGDDQIVFSGHFTGQD